MIRGESLIVNFHNLSQPHSNVRPYFFIEKIKWKSPYLHPQRTMSKRNHSHCYSFSHRLNSKKELSKLHSSLFSTYCSWLSMLNLNCKSSSPTSSIFRLGPNFQLLRSKFLAALRLIGLLVKNLPKRLSKHRTDLDNFAFLYC